MKDHKRENWLKDSQAKFEYRIALELNNINIPASLANQARIDEPLIDDMVEDYVVAMDGGDQFPAIVVFQRLKQKDYVIIDGNHRVAAAARLGHASIDAYVVDSEDASEIDILTRSANAIEGFRENREKRVEQAKYVVGRYGITIKEASARFKLNASVLQKALKVESAAGRLAKQGISHKSLSDTALYRLDSLPDSAVFAKAAAVSIAADLISDEVSSLVTRMRNESSEAKRLEALHAFENTPEIQQRIKTRGTKRSRKYTPRMQLFRLLSTLESHLQTHHSAAELQILNKGDIERLMHFSNFVSSALNALLQEARESLKYEVV
jgi:ParB-like chromosome segregation protein Spo0J